MWIKRRIKMNFIGGRNDLIGNIEVFKYTMLDASKSDEEQNMFEEPKKRIDLDALHTEGQNTAADGIFSTFFEEPGDGEMTTGISILFQSKQISFQVLLQDTFYNKLIGKYLNKKELHEKLIKGLQKAFDGVCWKGVAKKGGCDGHCH